MSSPKSRDRQNLPSPTGSSCPTSPDATPSTVNGFIASLGARAASNTPAAEPAPASRPMTMAELIQQRQRPRTTVLPDSTDAEGLLSESDDDECRTGPFDDEPLSGPQRPVAVVSASTVRRRPLTVAELVTQASASTQGAQPPEFQSPSPSTSPNSGRATSSSTSKPRTMQELIMQRQQPTVQGSSSSTPTATVETSLRSQTSFTSRPLDGLAPAMGPTPTNQSSAPISPARTMSGAAPNPMLPPKHPKYKDGTWQGSYTLDGRNVALLLHTARSGFSPGNFSLRGLAWDTAAQWFTVSGTCRTRPPFEWQLELKEVHTSRILHLNGSLDPRERTVSGLCLKKQLPSTPWDTDSQGSFALRCIGDVDSVSCVPPPSQLEALGWPSYVFDYHRMSSPQLAELLENFGLVNSAHALSALAEHSVSDLVCYSRPQLLQKCGLPAAEVTMLSDILMWLVTINESVRSLRSPHKSELDTAATRHLCPVSDKLFMQICNFNHIAAMPVSHLHSYLTGKVIPPTLIPRRWSAPTKELMMSIQCLAAWKHKQTTGQDLFLLDFKTMCSLGVAEAVIELFDFFFEYVDYLEDRVEIVQRVRSRELLAMLNLNSVASAGILLHNKPSLVSPSIAQQAGSEEMRNLLKLNMEEPDRLGDAYDRPLDFEMGFEHHAQPRGNSARFSWMSRCILMCLVGLHIVLPLMVAMPAVVFAVSGFDGSAIAEFTTLPLHVGSTAVLGLVFWGSFLQWGRSNRPRRLSPGILYWTQMIAALCLTGLAMHNILFKADPDKVTEYGLYHRCAFVIRCFALALFGQRVVYAYAFEGHRQGLPPPAWTKGAIHRITAMFTLFSTMEFAFFVLAAKPLKIQILWPVWALDMHVIIIMCYAYTYYDTWKASDDEDDQAALLA